MLPRVRVTLCRPLVIVECDARRDHVDEGETPMLEPSSEDRDELGLVTRKTTRDEGTPESQRQECRIDGRLRIGLAPLGPGPHVRRGGELSLGETVDAVVLDDV